MGIARHFEVFSQYLVKMYRGLEFLTMFLAFLVTCNIKTLGVSGHRPACQYFFFSTLSKETGRVLRDLPEQARPVSSTNWLWCDTFNLVYVTFGSIIILFADNVMIMIWSPKESPWL